MKIIKAGKLPEEQEFEAKCTNCETVFSFLRKECCVSFDKNENFLTVNCPLCQKKVYKNLVTRPYPSQYDR